MGERNDLKRAEKEGRKGKGNPKVTEHTEVFLVLSKDYPKYLHQN